MAAAANLAAPSSRISLMWALFAVERPVRMGSPPEQIVDDQAVVARIGHVDAPNVVYG